MVRLIADSGSTKTTWCLVDETLGTPTILKPVQTQGLNPLYATDEEISAATRQVVQHVGNLYPDKVQFYGAGCSGDRIELVENALRRVFTPATHIEVASDVLGACRALYPASGRDGLPTSGIACILGTGAIAARYSAQTDHFFAAPSLGYILGDEGSGAWLGRRVLSDYLKGQMPKTARALFEADYGQGAITAEQVIQKVYKQTFPNRYLASFAVFVGRHLENQYCQQLAFEGMEAFLKRNVQSLQPKAGEPISFVGSVAFHLRDILQSVAALYNLSLIRVLKEPIEGLVKG